MKGSFSLLTIFSVVLIIVVLACAQTEPSSGGDNNGGGSNTTQTTNSNGNTAITFSSIQPVSGSDNVSISATFKIIINFSGNLDSTKGSVKIGDRDFLASEISISGNVVSISPAPMLAYSTTYTGLSISGFKSSSGNIMSEYNNAIYTFKTAEDLSAKALGERYPDSGTYSPVSKSSWGLESYALGANYNGSDVEFAVYSKNATKILLEIYDQKSGADAVYDYWMEKKGSDNIWRAKLKGIPNGTLYAFRVWGPNWPYDSSWTRGNSAVGFSGDNDFDSNGNRFNPNKVLFDPYAKEISHDKSNPNTLGDMDGNIYGTGPVLYKSIARRNYDTGRYAPKSVVVKDSTGFGTKPNIPAKDAIIYESHVRGLTNHSSVANLSTILSTVGITAENIPSQYRGTYKGATYLIPYFKSLGINTIEFVPVHETDNDANPDNSPGGNYWGYMTYGYFAPDRRYSSDKSFGGPTKEFKEMVKAFHEAGIEIYLDVVYNHSGEGGTWGTTDNTKAGYHEDNIRTTELTFLRGFDNSEYYSLVPSNKGNYWETTGCGNNLQCDNPQVRKLIIDSLTYWIDIMGVDGFRFDLAPVLGRESDGVNWLYENDAQTILDIVNLGTAKSVKMIAEAWDTATYQVGNFPNGWGEWNGRYRDSARRFVKGDSGSDIKKYIYGDDTSFSDQGGPSKTVNFIVAHDGFTLTDLVSYNDRNNDSSRNGGWPFGPSDGGSEDNDSWDCSWAGQTDGEKHSLRRQQVRNFFTLQMFSRGVPMIVWGDEFGRTQNGNNNPYNIDSVATWSNYNQINTDSPNAVNTGGGSSYHNNLGTDSNDDGLNNIFLFARNIMNTRKDDATLRTDNYSTTAYNFDTGSDGYDDHKIMVTINGTNKYRWYLNSHHEGWQITLPAPPTAGKKWLRIVDTQDYFEKDYNNFWNEESAIGFDGGATYYMSARSMVVFKEGDVIAPDTPTFSKDGVSKNVYVIKGATSTNISTATSGASIWYTLDGSDPRTSSTAQKFSSNTTNVPLTSTGGSNSKGGYRIRAVAKVGNGFSEIAEERYLISGSSYSIPTINSSGVMLQAFGWDSSVSESASPNTPKWYNTLTSKATEIKNFNWVWMPPPQDTLDYLGNGHQGYMPRELFKFSNRYGTEAEHRAAITAIKGGTNNTKLIADIVINHRVSSSSTVDDFRNPIWNKNQIAKNSQGFGAGAYDTGAFYTAAADVDHTNPIVQKDLIEFLRKLKEDMGYSGWRYDYVKGYAGEYVGYYNAVSEAEFSVGELWPEAGHVGEQNLYDNWVSATEAGGATSMVFDFALKETINSTIDSMSLAGLKRGNDSKQEGYVGWKPQNVVTFVDNHDTGSTQAHWPLTNNVYIAYVYILTQSGIPCVAWDDYLGSKSSVAIGNGKTMKQHIDELIRIRRAAAVTNQSLVVTQSSASDLYAAKVGDSLYMKIGSGSWSPAAGDISGWETAYSGNNFAVWYKNVAPTVKLNALSTDFGTVADSDTETRTFTITNTTTSSFNTTGKITLSGTGYTMSAVTPATIPAGGSGSFTITFSANGLADNTYTGSISITGYNSLNLTARRATMNSYTLTLTNMDVSSKPGFSVWFAGNFKESGEWEKAVRATGSGSTWTATVHSIDATFAWKAVVHYSYTGENEPKLISSFANGFWNGYSFRDDYIGPGTVDSSSVTWKNSWDALP